MSDTVLIAIITFLSGAVGASLGAFGAIKAAKCAVTGQMQQTLVQESFKLRAAAYQNVLEAQISMSMARYSEESIAAFVKAVNTACVVASPQTSVYLMQLRKAEKVRDVLAVQSIVTAALASMQKDLTVFDAPKIQENFWSQETTKAAKKDKASPTGV